VSQVSCPSCGALDTGRYCSKCGTTLRAGVLGPLRPVVAPFFLYPTAIGFILTPKRFSHKVLSGEVGLWRAVEFMIAAAVVVSLIVGVQTLLGYTRPPTVTNELLQTLGALFGVLVIGWPLHMLLNLRRSVKFKNLFTVYTTFTAALLPINIYSQYETQLYINGGSQDITLAMFVFTFLNTFFFIFFYVSLCYLYSKNFLEVFAMLMSFGVLIMAASLALTYAVQGELGVINLLSPILDAYEKPLNQA